MSGGGRRGLPLKRMIEQAGKTTGESIGKMEKVDAEKGMTSVRRSHMRIKVVLDVQKSIIDRCFIVLFWYEFLL